MPSARVQAILAKLEKGRERTRASLGQLTPVQWNRVVYADAQQWTLRDLLAHFLSIEVAFLRLCQDVAVGGKGTPADFDLDGFNAAELKRLAGRPPAELLEALEDARQKTLDWVRTLDDASLDRVGNHPALGQVTLETIILSIYGHQLFHMRESMSK